MSDQICSKCRGVGWIIGNASVGQISVACDCREEKEEKFKKLERENKLLREAVEYYAKVDHWTSSQGGLYANVKDVCIEPLNKNTFNYVYGGKKAREALEKIKGENEHKN